jgi:hypothetical protein
MHDHDQCGIPPCRLLCTAAVGEMCMMVVLRLSMLTCLSSL